MSGVGIVQVFAYVAVALFLVGMARRVARHARAQLALRWELYPVPHDVGKEHGGSYFEEFKGFLALVEKRSFKDRTWSSEYAEPMFAEARERLRREKQGG